MNKTISSLAILGALLGTAYADTTRQSTEGTNNMMAVSENARMGEAFLSANKQKPGVVVLPDGLQYKVLVEGKGPTPTDSDTVTVNYSGTLINGTEFDSSYKRGQPATFPVTGVIPGWVEALKLMKVGSTWELYIPPSLAYGKNGAPPVIGPDETLIFKVELLGINGKN